jgi:hypothetical protein
LIQRDSLGGAVPTRGHRHVGLPSPPQRERHWAIAGAVAAVVSAAVAAAASAYAMYEQGQSQAQAYKYQSELAENQGIAARQASEVAAAQAQEKNRRLMAMARTRAGASGIETTEGSPLLVLMDNAAEAELETRRIKYAGAVQEQGFRAESRLLTFEGANARRAGNIGAGATLLGGAAQAYAGYQRGQSRTPTTTTGSSTYGTGAASKVPTYGYD